ncbi:ribosome small subunit-dependent GTPase A [Syntrophomonas palmitatica]|uniref:ribosome small subunit-dependent GTPase A n=1 Tax=Syntrophomonas palmitatica TaxID=402877 RepID=UPI0006D1BCF7|nr:ribosome small subunit-dependent GTPase A [Syntrophomonas palmitatica]
MKAETSEGLVLKLYGGFYYVKDQPGVLYECKLRGKIKDQILVGDRVLFTATEEGQGVIESIQPRLNQLYRPKIANVDMVFIVMAHDRPAPSLALLDRLLFLVLYHNIVPCIVLNKCDLKEDRNTVRLREYYPSAGFDLISTSVTQDIGIEKILDLAAGRTAVLAGPSGSGKSSLINRLLGVKTRTGEISEKIGRGKHTTRHVELFALPCGGLIADSPGFTILDLPGVESRELSDYYPDFQDHRTGCRFMDCLHHRENDCGVKRAVEAGQIADFRYQNYLVLLEEVMKNERCYR